nr:uncharacterized protein LOC112025280 [Quercus suber]
MTNFMDDLYLLVYGLHPTYVVIMVFLATQNALPTIYNLWRRNVVGLVLCSSCKSDSEDIDYSACFMELCFPYSQLGDKRSGNKITQFRRNSARVGDHFIEVQQIRKRAVAYLWDFQHVQCSKVHRSLSSERAVWWIPPIYPLYKVDSDGATFKKLGAAGLGVVVRDHTGSVIGALAERIQLPSSPAVVEALACRRALYFAKKLSIFKVSVEGDSKVIIKAILAGDMANPEYGHVINDILFVANDF